MEHQQNIVEQITERPIDQSLLDACIHCGLCLPACPTYLATGRELESPRGRIYLLNLWQQGKQPFSSRMAEHLDSCLGCLGCQTACPSGVNYEAIFNQAKVEVNAVAPLWQRVPRYLAFKWLLPNDQLLKLMGQVLRLWQYLKFDKASCAILSPFKSIMFIREILRWQSLLPTVLKQVDLPKTTNGTGTLYSSIQLFKGCVMDVFYNQVNRESLQLLALTSSCVTVPEQTCCGALACHAGEKALAVELAKKNIDYFTANEGPIVATASGCTAMLKTYPELFSAHDPWHERAKNFSARIQDLPEILSKQQLPISNDCRLDNLAKPITIAYHAACHLAHAQNIRNEPKQLLENFAQAVNSKTGCQTVTLVPLIEEEYCCGSAGIYNLGHPTLSDKILSRKIEMIKASGADMIVTTNPGCILQLQAGIKGEKLTLGVYHIATLLAKAYLSSF